MPWQPPLRPGHVALLGAALILTSLLLRPVDSLQTSRTSALRLSAGVESSIGEAPSAAETAPPVPNMLRDGTAPEDLEPFVRELEERSPAQAPEWLGEIARDVKRPTPARVWCLRRLAEFHPHADQTWLLCLVRKPDDPEVTAEAERILRSREGLYE